MNSTLKAFHGGSFWKQIGYAYERIGALGNDVVNADVLDAWFDPSPKAIKAVQEHLPTLLSTSPPTHANGLITTIAEIRGIPEKNIIVGGGSSDIMFALFPNLLSNGDKTLILDPMYGEYEHIFTTVINTDLHRHPLHSKTNFSANVNDLISDINTIQPNVVVIVNPNSPTGQYIDKKDLITILDQTPGQTIFVIDEAYIEYIGVQHSLEQEVKKRKNLIVLKSMSKVYALSGARAAYAVLPDKLICTINTHIPPWSISNIGQLAAIEALKDKEYYGIKYAQTHELREEMMNALRDISGITVYPSHTSYFLIELVDQKLSAQKVIGALEQQGVFLRNCDSMSVQFKDNVIRIAVKNKEKNVRIIREIRKYMSGKQ